MKTLGCLGWAVLAFGLFQYLEVQQMNAVWKEDKHQPFLIEIKQFKHCPML